MKKRYAFFITLIVFGVLSVISYFVTDINLDGIPIWALFAAIGVGTASFIVKGMHSKESYSNDKELENR